MKWRGNESPVNCEPRPFILQEEDPHNGAKLAPQADVKA